ncbi:hypothetical protein GOP47_0000718 [Adiantum capillus-veneris]|uniref:Uncharacterized protein n=1 Tax=Adiantum capillus-veneris TaxID=13818 RepID=A0A9D4ZQS7_ADICA|nr:hypothetical protein GOP47_0000718 [Adiantum capillus-veneris]
MGIRGALVLLVMQYVHSCEGGRRVEKVVEEHKYSNGSWGALFVVVVVIAVLGLLAGLLARLCNGRHRAGNLDYDFEGWVEKKCASCIDGSLDLPPPPTSTSQFSYPTSAHLLSNIAAVSPAPPPPSSTGLLPPPPPQQSLNGGYHQPAPSLVQIEITNGAAAPPALATTPYTPAAPMGAGAPVNVSTTTATGTSSARKKKKRKSGGGGGGAAVGAAGAVAT